MNTSKAIFECINHISLDHIYVTETVSTAIELLSKCIRVISDNDKDGMVSRNEEEMALAFRRIAEMKLNDKFTIGGDRLTVSYDSDKGYPPHELFEYRTRHGLDLDFNIHVTIY